MTWEEVCAHPSLQNLPFKIETNQWGQVVMSPVKIPHSAYQGEINGLLRDLMQNGRVLVECAIATTKGTKVADVAWASPALFRRIKNEAACSVAPEICVEVYSFSNTQKEMKEKRELYVEKGAKEVWYCDKNGKISFYNEEGKLKKSALCPDFPGKIKL
ncbi:MAG TPA: Uma2 family endonuclease [Blastocatellia bacterium]|nr:Uma2 family endonuclease [Blastocatellia bacterium]